MDGKTYQRLCQRSDSPHFFPVDLKLAHAAMGMSTEANEFLDAIKKAMFYNRPMDRVNLIEELGDICWYISLAATALGVEWEYIWTRNILKLKARYPHKFTCESANVRDLENEREVLENGD